MALSVVLIALLIPCVSSFEVDLARLYPQLPAHPVNWTVANVSHWMSRSLLLPEYATAFEANVVDGPTLLYLEEGDLKYLNVTNPVHLKKVIAHIDLLRGNCLCPLTSPEVDFWEFARTNQYKVLLLGACIEYAPRLGLTWLVLFEPDTFNAVLGYTGDEGPALWVVLGVVALGFVAPHGMNALLSLRFFFPNYLVVSAVVISQVSRQYLEFYTIKNTLPGLREPRYEWRDWWNFIFFLDSDRSNWVVSTLAPFAMAIIGLVLPWFIELILLYLVIGRHLLLFSLYWVRWAAMKWTGQEGQEEKKSE